MAWSVRVGRILGIELRLHVTFLLLLAWVAWSRYVQGGAALAVQSLIALLTLFTIVLAHELGHALVARRFGVGTRHITLLPIGGVATMERAPSDPRAELWIALAGPAVNLLMAALVGGALWLSGGHLGPPPLVAGTTDFWSTFVWVNLSLGAFNLLPAFPMDGGRVLRAALGLRVGHVRATQLAAGVGQALAVGLGLVGLVGNPLLVLIAAFVWLGAASAARMARLREALEDVPVECIMQTDVIGLAPQASAREVARLALTTAQDPFPVLRGSQVIGVVTRDGLLAALTQGDRTLRVADIMVDQPRLVRPWDMVDGLIEELAGAGPRAYAFVVDGGGALVGMVTRERIGELVMAAHAWTEHTAGLHAASRRHRPRAPRREAA